MLEKTVEIFRSKRSARIALLCCSILFLILFLLVELIDRSNKGLLLYRTAYLLVFIISSLAIIHSNKFIAQLRCYKFLRQPFIYWLIFVVFSSWFVFSCQNTSRIEFTGFLKTYGTPITYFQALSYVVNLVTFSDPGEILPVTVISKVGVMIIKVSQLAFLIWFISDTIGLRRSLNFADNSKKEDFIRCHDYMQEILRKSSFVNQFFIKLEEDISQSQANISGLEKKRKELEGLKGIEQKETEALLNSLGGIVQKELKKTARPNFISNLTSGGMVALIGYFAGKIIESIFR